MAHDSHQMTASSLLRPGWLGLRFRCAVVLFFRRARRFFDRWDQKNEVAAGERLAIRGSAIILPIVPDAVENPRSRLWPDELQVIHRHRHSKGGLERQDLVDRAGHIAERPIGEGIERQALELVRNQLVETIGKAPIVLELPDPDGDDLRKSAARDFILIVGAEYASGGRDTLWSGPGRSLNRS